MAETISTAPDGSLLGSPSGMLALRIRGTERDGQVVRLRAARIAIGASPSCTLRLRAPGVADTHCMILRGQEQTIVRRCSPDTRLNGAAFEEAVLHIGDRLGIGPIELQVVDDATALDEPKDAQRQSLEQERQRLASDRDAWEGSLAAREAEFAQRLEALERRLTELDNERRQIDADRDDLQRERFQFDAERDHVRASRSSESVSHEADDERGQPSADDEDSLFARLRELDVLKHDTSDDTPVAEQDSSAPVDAEEPDSQAMDAPGQPDAAEEVPESASNSAALPTAAGTTEEEESIDDYMARLLKRMRGAPAEEPDSPTDSQCEVSDLSRAQALDTSESDAASSTAGMSGEPPRLEKLEPRKAAPERARNLAAMREIANITARTAIASHHQKRSTTHAVQKLILAGIALVFSILLVLAAPFGSFYFIGGLTGLIASIVWFAQGGGMLRRSGRKPMMSLQSWDLPSSDDDSCTPDN